MPVIFLLLPTAVSAQGCPAGIPSAGNPACIPQDRENSPYYQGGQGQGLEPRWHLTWGAIASDSGTGDIGVAVGKYSKVDAQREALERCADHGATKCKVLLAYHNQCAAIAWPTKNGDLVGGTSVTRGGPSVEDASAGALSSCAAKNYGGLCKIIYSDCTKPVLQN